MPKDVELYVGLNKNLKKITSTIPDDEPKPWDGKDELKYIGKRVPRIDGHLKTTGRAQYSIDMQLPGMLYARFLRSPHPSALVKEINYSQAAKLPGVKAIVTVYDELLASIASDQTICYNTAPDLLTSTASGGDGTYTYQWQDSPDGISWTDISGATSDTYQPPTLPNTTYYQLIVDDETCTPVTTNSAIITVYDELLASINTDQSI